MKINFLPDYNMRSLYFYSSSTELTLEKLVAMSEKSSSNLKLGIDRFDEVIREIKKPRPKRKEGWTGQRTKRNAFFPPWDEYIHVYT